MKNSKVKILVCYHKPDVLVKDDVFTPIHVGRALARQRAKEGDKNFEWMLENTIGDDTGDNISNKNMSFNELTAVYWVWKNYDKLGNPDYIGLCHYRRYFLFRKSKEVVEEIREIGDKFFDYINYNKDTMNHLFDDCDYIAHIGHVDGIYKHYKENHHIEDLDLACKIAIEKYPEYAKTVKDYLNFSYGNFFNMFIMPKDLFFKYCEWLFDILFEFEKQVDLSEKRLFISERLTGMFIEHLKRTGHKQKSLSVAFVNADSRTPIAIPYCDSKFKTAVTMLSVLKNAKPGSFVDFYLLHQTKDNVNKDDFKDIINQFEGTTITYVNVDEVLKEKQIDAKKFKLPEQYPLVVSNVLDKVGKLLYLNEKVLCFGDIATFYRECNNDEFYVLGLKEEGKACNLGGDIFCLHAGRIRNHKLIEEFAKHSKGKTSSEVFAETCENKIGLFCWWNNTHLFDEKEMKMCDDKNTRGNIRWDKGVWNRPILYYGEGFEPWKYVQSLYSVYWWEVASKIPSSIKFDAVEDEAYPIFYEQSAEVCFSNTNNAKKSQRKSNVAPSAQPQKVCLFKKVYWYYKVHGFKACVKRVFTKIFGGKNEK